jgi:SAM-dependent MidA family methyltransferase
LSTPLEEILIARIRDSGPMPFAAFMSLALYHPHHGYYTAGPARVGWRGHFLTSPELDPGFGALWAAGFENIWRRCGEPDRFEVIEIGPGEGGFAAAVLRSVAGRFARSLTFRLVERSPALRERQERALDGFDRVEWSPSITEVDEVAHGCVFANEVLDNLPVHLVERTAAGLREICVSVEDDHLIFVELAPSNPELQSFFDRCAVELPEGHRAEVSLAGESFVARVAGMFDTGCAVFVDYGASASDLVARPMGSLLAYSQSGTDERVLEDVGSKDITAHANWTSVMGACRRAGLETKEPITQRHALQALGLHALHDELRVAHDVAVKEKRGADAVAALSRRQALGALADPGGLGGLQTVIAGRGIELEGVPSA